MPHLEWHHKWRMSCPVMIPGWLEHQSRSECSESPCKVFSPPCPFLFFMICTSGGNDWISSCWYKTFLICTKDKFVHSIVLPKKQNSQTWLDNNQWQYSATICSWIYFFLRNSSKYFIAVFVRGNFLQALCLKDMFIWFIQPFQLLYIFVCDLRDAFSFLACRVGARRARWDFEGAGVIGWKETQVVWNSNNFLQLPAGQPVNPHLSQI